MTLPLSPSKDALLAELKQRLGDYAVEGWENRSGDELYQAIARVFSHLAQRTHAFALSAYVRRARGPHKHRLTLRLSWSLPTQNGWTLAAGQLLFATAWGARFRLLEDLVCEAESPAHTLDIEVEAEWTGFDFIVAPHTVTQWALPQSSDLVSSLQWVNTTPAGKYEFLSSVGMYGTKPWLSVTNLPSESHNDLGLPLEGATGLLDLLALERGLPREANEDDEVLRTRIQALPDILTPAALKRAVEAAFLAGMEELYGGYAGASPITFDEGWRYGDAPSVGACGVHPPARAWAFQMTLPRLPYGATGDAPSLGACGIHPCGSTGEAAREGLISALSALIQRTKAPGVWGALYER